MTLEQMENIAVLIGSHGNEMEVGGRLKQKLDINPIPGVIYRVAHPFAVKVGERYLGELGESEIMGQYPGIADGNPEQVAAYGNFQWIQEKNPLTVQDIHESTISGSYFAVGETTTVATIACARMLGSDICLVNNGSAFYQFVPQGASIENSLVDSDPSTIATTIYNGLQQATATNLQQISFEEAIAGLTFYQKFEIGSYGSNATTTPFLELETVPSMPRFSKLELSGKQRTLVNIPSEAQIVYGTWGYANMSNLVPERLGYTEDGTPRREFFGDILVKIAPPIQGDNECIIFQRETRNLSRKPRGLLRLAS